MHSPKTLFFSHRGVTGKLRRLLSELRETEKAYTSRLRCRWIINRFARASNQSSKQRGHLNPRTNCVQFNSTWINIRCILFINCQSSQAKFVWDLLRKSWLTGGSCPYFPDRYPLHCTCNKEINRLTMSGGEIALTNRKIGARTRQLAISAVNNKYDRLFFWYEFKRSSKNTYFSNLYF